MTNNILSCAKYTIEYEKYKRNTDAHAKLHIKIILNQFIKRVIEN